MTRAERIAARRQITAALGFPPRSPWPGVIELCGPVNLAAFERYALRVAREQGVTPPTP